MNDSNYIASLVRKVRKNDPIAMRTLYEAHSKQMMATSLRITNNTGDSEDIIQEALIQSFQKIGQLKTDDKYGAWLKRIVTSKSLQVIKKRITFSDLSEVSDIYEADDEQGWYRDITFDKIKNELQNLPNGCRTIFSLYLLEGYKHKEIAEELGISVSNSKSQYRYALKLLREKLQEHI